MVSPSYRLREVRFPCREHSDGIRGATIPEMPKPAVIIVDDEPDICEPLSIGLKRMSLAVRITRLAGAAQRLLKSERFDLCLTDNPGARHYDELQRRAAKMLGIALRALRYRVKKLGIE